MWIFGLIKDGFVWSLKCSLVIIEFSRFSLRQENDSIQHLKDEQEKITDLIYAKFSKNGRLLRNPEPYSNQNKVSHSIAR
jgi:hypothetical protein